MPGDTKIKKTTNGWIDVDRPTIYHSVRREARDARRKRVQYYAFRGVVPPIVAVPPAPTAPVFSGSVVPPINVGLTSLQQRLYDRLTQRQGVTAADAYDVIKNNGYNKAASYGHMREAGANHSEAEIVIDIGVPAVSVAYGLARASGKDHTAALKEALLDDD